MAVFSLKYFTKKKNSYFSFWVADNSSSEKNKIKQKQEKVILEIPNIAELSKNKTSNALPAAFGRQNIALLLESS